MTQRAADVYLVHALRLESCPPQFLVAQDVVVRPTHRRFDELPFDLEAQFVAERMGEP